MTLYPGLTPENEFEFDISRFNARERAAFISRLERDGPRSVGEFWAHLYKAVEIARGHGVEWADMEGQVIGDLYDMEELRYLGPKLRHETISLATGMVEQAIEKQVGHEQRGS